MTSRDDRLERLRSKEPWDVVIIGGGATGLGAGVDAASRGYKTLLLEAQDFAEGTSSRSTKLIHGGVRYLARGNVALVREALRERGRLFENAPHLVHDRAFLIPAYRWWERPYYALGLWLYDRLAGTLGIGDSRMVGRDEALALVPTLEPEKLRGGVVYHDGQFDDSRLAIALYRTMEALGGTALNAMAVVGLLKDQGGKITGVRARDAESLEEFDIHARGVVNATGVFADEVRRMDEPNAQAMIAPSQGAHIVLDRSFLPGETAVLVPKTDDGRVIFAIPWHTQVIIGTTDTPVNETSRDPVPLSEEVDFLLRHVARYLSKDPRPEDVRSTFAGLRPLIAKGAATRTASLSREHAALVSASGMVTITGGKWTTYRRMAENAVDLLARSAGFKEMPCTTTSLKLHAWTKDVSSDHLGAYGADAAAVVDLIKSRPGWDDLLHRRLPYQVGEVAWAIRFEAARTVEDVLARRLRALFLDARAAIEAAPRVASVLAEELGRDQTWRDEQIRQFEQLAANYLIAPMKGPLCGPY